MSFLCQAYCAKRAGRSLKLSRFFALLCATLCVFQFFSPTASAESYNLERSVQTALESNFRIVSAQASREAAEEGRKAARGAFGPVLGTSYEYDRKQHKTIVLGRVQDNDLATWSAALNQNVFAGFATLASYQKAALQKENAEASLAKARLDLIRAVQDNFFAYLKAQENVRSAEDSLTRLSSQLKVTRSFYDVGLKPHLDVLQAEVDVSEAESVLLRAQNTAAIQHARLNTLLNLPLEASADYIGSLNFIPFSSSLDECLAIAYSTRPDLFMARKSVEIAQKDRTLVESGYYPQVNASMGWATQGNHLDAAGTTLNPQGYSAWNIGVIGQWNVFEWGKTYYSSSQAQKIVTKTQADADGLKVEVSFEVQSRLIDLDVAAKRIKVASKAVEQAKEAYRMAAARYESQVGASIDVLDAQAKLTAAEVSLSGAKADYLTALADLYSAMGKENYSLK